MNNIFKVIWNHATQTWVAVSELSKSHGKSKNRATRKLAAVATVSLLAVGVVNAEPYFSVNSTDQSADSNYDGKGAIYVDPTDSTKNSNNAIAAGPSASAKGKSSVALGYKANAGQDGAVAVGSNTEATNAGVALGDTAKSIGKNAAALGWGSHAIGRADVFIGKKAGENTTNTENFSNIGIGESAIKDVGDQKIDNVIGIGTGAAAGIKGSHNIALGDYANSVMPGDAGGTPNPAVDKSYTIAIGTRARATQENSISMGQRAESTGIGSIAFGVNSKASNWNSLAIGKKTLATGAGAIAIGGSSNEGDGNVPETNGAAATAAQGVALGQLSESTEHGSLALGAGAKSLSGKAVALGWGSLAEFGAATSTNEATVNGITYSGFAGNKAHSEVSVGRAADPANNIEEIKRTIVNVAAGRITKESTDAINGSQLYAVLDQVGNTRTYVNGGKHLTVDESQDTAYGPGTLYTVNVLTTEISDKTTNGKITVPTGRDLAVASDVAKAINAAYWTASAGKTGTGTSEVVDNAQVKAGDTVTFQAGNNMHLKQDGTTFNYSLKKDLADIESIKLGNVDAQGKQSGATAKVTVEQGAKGLDKNDGPSGASKTRLIYEKADGVKETVATLNDGLIFKGDGDTTISKKLNETIQITGGASSE